MGISDVFSKLSDAHVKFATLFERVAKIATDVKDLSGDIARVSERVARLEGANSNSAVPELMRQIESLQKRLLVLEARQFYESPNPPPPQVELKGHRRLKPPKSASPPG
jgi:predicted  nucleic acid-binding Zn-ribbon protein